MAIVKGPPMWYTFRRKEGFRNMKERVENTPYINIALIVICAAYFIFLEVTGSSEDAYYMYTMGAITAPAVRIEGEYWRLLTAMFMHFGIAHIINNMIVLFALGGYLERALGHVKYLIFYLICGIGSNWVSVMFTDPLSLVVSAGASGAIFGITGGLFYIIVRNRGRLEDLSTRQIILMIVLSLYIGLVSRGVDNIAHISGLIIGFILALIMYRKPKPGYADRLMKDL